MYEVAVEARFSAAHRHPLEDGRRPLHGHDFQVVARVEGAMLEDDVLVDFHAVARALEALLGQLGHRDLDQHPWLAGREATPAALARLLFERLRPEVDRPGLRLASLEVRDTERSGARFFP